MSSYRLLPVLILFFGINLQMANAASVLGKVSIYASPTSDPEVFPLVSGTKVSYPSPAIIKITGGTLLADKGAVLETADEDETIIFKVERGDIYFKLEPHKIRVLFRTAGGDIYSPLVTPASESIIEGKIEVSDRGTSVEIMEGTMGIQTGDGTGTITSGQTKFLAQADLIRQIAGIEACPEAQELIGLVDENGIVDDKELVPEGEVLAGGKTRNAVWVDDNLEIVKEGKLPKDEPVEVIGAVINKDNVVISQQFLAEHPGIDTKTVGEKFKECTLLVHNLEGTGDAGALTAAASAIALFTCAIFCGDDGNDRAASPTQ